MGEALTIEARHERGYPVVTVAGEIDIATAARLRERLFELADGGRPLVADLDQVRFIDSAGLAVLVGAANRAAAHGGSLHVVCARPRVRQLLRLTGLDRRLTACPHPGRGPGRLDGGPGHAPLGLWLVAISMSKPLTCGYGGALGGTRTPNLLIRRSGQVVQDRPSPVVRWADVPQLSACVSRCPPPWQQYWQQLQEPETHTRSVQGMLPDLATDGFGQARLGVSMSRAP